MKKHVDRQWRARTAALTGLLAAALVTPAMAADEAGRELVRPADSISFSEVIPGVSKAVLWGDPGKGPYATLTKFAKGTKNALHTHTRDIRLVVVSGTLVEDFGNGPQRLGPGSYVFEPAGKPHTNGAGDDAECVFVEQSDGPFDIQWLK